MKVSNLIKTKLNRLEISSILRSIKRDATICSSLTPYELSRFIAALQYYFGVDFTIECAGDFDRFVLHGLENSRALQPFRSSKSVRRTKLRVLPRYR